MHLFTRLDVFTMMYGGSSTANSRGQGSERGLFPLALGLLLSRWVCWSRLRVIACDRLCASLWGNEGYSSALLAARENVFSPGAEQKLDFSRFCGNVRFAKAYFEEEELCGTFLYPN